MDNRVREYRLRSGRSQTELASLANVSRQAISLIETGRAVPSALVALRLARAFGSTVEQLFEESSPSPERIEPVAPGQGDDLGPGDRVILCETGANGRFVRRAAWPSVDVWPTARATGTVTRRTACGEVAVLRSDGDPWDAITLVAGCDIGIGFLTAHARMRSGGGSLAWRAADNRLALRELAQGTVSVAAVHGPADGRAQTEWRAAAPSDIVRVQFANWRMGWVTRPGAGFGGAQELAGGASRLVNRPPGAGARTLLDDALRQASVPPVQVRGYEWHASGHMQVAQAVAEGGADTGIAMESAAASFGLAFIPLQEERCELWIPACEFGREPVLRLLDVLTTDAFRSDLVGFGPYDVTHTGERTGEIRS